MDGTKYLDENFLCYIFSIFGILNNTDSCIENPVLVVIYQKFKGSFIPVTEALYQLLFIQRLSAFDFCFAFGKPPAIEGRCNLRKHV